MPIDPSIALNVKQLQLPNPLEQYGQFQQAQAAMSQNRLADLVLGEKRREAAETAQVNMLYKGATGENGALDRNKLLGSVAAAGLGSKYQALQKGFLDLDKGQADVAKTQADTAKAQADALTKKLDIAGQAFGHVRANPTLENANATLDFLVGNGTYTAEQGAQYKALVASDPTQIAALADQAFRSALSAKDQLATYQTRNTGATTDTLAIDPVTGKVTVASSVKNTVSPDAQLQANISRANNAATVAATERGQNMTDARAREQVAAGKVPSGYRQAGDGTLVPIPGGPADPKNKPPTEFQGKSAAFGARAEEADRLLTGLQGQYSPAGINAKNTASDIWGVGGALGTLGNNALSDASQRADQAQRDFVNAVLRQESGAAIGASEFDNARKQYFPQPGDSAAVIQQKAANRKLAVQGLKTNAGPAAFSAPQPGAPAAAPPGKPAGPPPKNAKGWTLHVDAGGNRAYVSPDGKQYEEVH